MAKRRARKGSTSIIQNTTDAVQSFFDSDGQIGPARRRYDLAPREVREVPEEVALLWLSHRSPFVILYEETPMPSIPSDKQVWVANMTGNPFVPETVELERRHRGEKIKYDAPNPLRSPQVIRREMKGHQRVVATEDGNDKQVITDPPLRFEIAPYRARPVSETYAHWMLERDGRQVDHHQGKLVECRPLSGEMPNSTWPLAELQCYAQMIGYRPLLEERSDIMGVKDEYGEFISDDEYGSPQEAEAVRIGLAQALYFVAVDPMVAIPDYRDFQEEFEVWESDRRARRKKNATGGSGKAA